MSEAPDWEGSAKSGEEALQRLAAAVPQGVALLRRGRIVWASERLLELTGWASMAALVGTRVEALFEDLGQGLPDASRSRPIECGLRRANGQELTVIWRPIWPEIAPGTDAWVVEDASHVRSLERELLHMSRELHRLHRDVARLRDRLEGERVQREELLGVVSHELRTPLTVIGGYHRLLLGEEVGPLNDQQREFLEESRRGCRQLDGFVENLLEASRIPNTGEVLEVSNALVDPVIREAVAALRPLLDEHGIELTLSLDFAGRARFDRSALVRVINNLVGNAIRHGGAGGRAEIATRAVSVDDRPFAEILVSDDGPGVAPEERERIFEPYVRGNGRSGGLGLGLAICRRLVEAHGGQIDLAGVPGPGARFRFTLPEEAE